jgi:hypothetical protein
MLIKLLPPSFTLKTVVTRSSEKLVAISETMQRHNPDDHTVFVHCIWQEKYLTDCLTNGSLQTPLRMS